MSMNIINFGSGPEIPILGFGTWQVEGESCKQSVLKALEVGYRHIDTADMYGNHKQVGEAIKESGVPREEIFLTTKLWQDNYKKEKIRPELERALQELGTDYLDLWLMHWPDRKIPFEETMGAMKELQDEGQIKDIGVANFTVHHLQDALDGAVPFSMNQVEFHPSLYQKDLLDFCRENDIALTAYSPIARGQDLKLPVIKEIANKRGVSESQTIINWLIQKDIIAIPKAETPAHIEDNWKSLDWSLDEEEVKMIDEIGGENRVVEPSFADFDY
jgi:2,5-diketo-D-gluconate reductase B